MIDCYIKRRRGLKQIDSGYCAQEIALSTVVEKKLLQQVLCQTVLGMSKHKFHDRADGLFKYITEFET